MKKLLFTGLFAAMIVACFAQKPYKVVFYNFENLFDTLRDPEIYDAEFTPEGPKKWNTAKYTKKINNLSRVLFDIAAIDKDYPVVIGVSEIENRTVLEDVIATPKLAPANYRIVHYDSPDARGVDVAFYYRPDVFKLEGSHPIPFTMESLPNFRTRDIVTMWGTIEGEPFYFMVAHWPSRLGGKEASDPKRERAAEIMRHAADSVLAINPATKVVMMGDFNDDATDKSITETLGARADIRKLAPGDWRKFNIPDGYVFAIVQDRSVSPKALLIGNPLSVQTDFPAVVDSESVPVKALQQNAEIESVQDGIDFFINFLQAHR